MAKICLQALLIVSAFLISHQVTSASQASTQRCDDQCGTCAESQGTHNPSCAYCKFCSN